jgi:hypothetical protein
MRTRNVLVLAAALVLLAALMLWAQAPPAKPAAQEPAQEAAPPVPPAPTGPTRFKGTVANTGGSLYLGGFFTVQIDKWSTPEEIAELKQVLATSGQDAVLEKVWKAKQIGYLKIGSSLGKPLFFARAIPIPGGLVVRALTNQPIAGGIGSGGRAQNFPFGVLEMIVPADGKGGAGTIVPMAQISLSPNGTPQVEAYGNLPLKIMEVAIEPPKK